MLICVLILLNFSLCCTNSSAESFEQKMSRVRYGDVRGASRVEAYQDLLKSINRGFASEAESQEFVSNVLGILRQRPTSDAATLRLLSDLVRSILSSRVVVLQRYAKDFMHWRDVLETDLRKFVLADGDIVRVRLQGSLDKCLSVIAGEESPRVDVGDSDGLSTCFKLGLRSVGADLKDGSVISGGSRVDFMPLYWGRSGVNCALCDDYSVQFQGDVLAQTPVVTTKKYSQDGALPFEIRKREKSPAYSHEPLIVAHPGCGEWTTIIEKVSNEAVVKLENDNIQQALARIRVMPTHLDKIKWLQALAGNFNSRISEKNSTAFLKQFSVLMGARSQFDHQTLLAARQLVQLYERISFFKLREQNFSDWLKAINQLLEPHAIKFGDVIKVANKKRTEDVLCVAPYVKGGARECSKEIRLGVGPVHGSGHGHSLMSFVSAVGKQGAMYLGDEVELSLPHVDGTTQLRCVLLSADGLGEGRVVALNDLDVDADADTVFILEAISGPDLRAQAGIPVVAGDPFVLRSKKNHKILGYRLVGDSSLWTKIEPYDESSLTKTDRAFQFCINPMPSEAVSNVVTQSFCDKLASIRQEASSYPKIVRLMILLDSFSPMVSLENQDVFWDVVVSILVTKKYMHEHELSKLTDLLNKIILVAKVNHVDEWSRRAQQALIDVEFYKKVRRAVAIPGMDRFKALMDLAPEVKNVSLAESQNFVATLKTLSNYKKDQARAAKLLLAQVIDESSADLTVTGSGNLLVP